MFCSKCGAKLAENAAFCGVCGNKINNVNSTEEPKAEAVEEKAEQTEVLNNQSASEPVLNETDSKEAEPAAQQPVAEETLEQKAEQPAAEAVEPKVEAVASEQNFADASFEQKPKKKVKILPILIAVAAVVAAIALVVIIFFNQIAGFFIKTFGSDEAYFKYVEMQSIKGYAEDVTNFYGIATDNLGASGASETQVSFNVSQDITKFVNAYSGSDLDFNFLNNTVIKINTNVNDGDLSAEAILNINNSDVIDVSMFSEQDKKEMFIAILELSDEYLSLDTSDVDFDYTSFMADEDFVKALPSEKELDKLIEKYLKIAIDNLNNVEKSKDTISVNGIDQKVTVLEFELDTKTVMNIAKDVLKAVKEDKDIKKHIEKIGKYIEDEEIVYGFDADDFYDEFKDGVKYALDDLKEADFDNQEILTLIDYVDNSHKIVGRTLKMYGQEVAYYVTAEKGNNFATEAAFNNVYISGEGSKKNNKTNGEYTVKVAGNEMANITVTDFDTKKLEDGYVNGKISIKPTAYALQYASYEIELPNSITSILNYAIEIEMKSDKQSASLNVGVSANDSILASVNLASKKVKATKVAMPNGSEIKKAYDVNDWFANFNFDKLADALEKAGISISALEDLYRSDEPDYDYDYDFEEDYDLDDYQESVDDILDEYEFTY